MSDEVNRGCQRCKYWKRVGKSEECMGYCDYFFMTGKTRLSLHRKAYQALETEEQREEFLRDMVVHCREREDGRRPGAHFIWRLTDGRSRRRCRKHG